MSKYSSLRELHTAIADEIRAKTGSTDGIKVEDLPEAVASIPSGSVDPYLIHTFVVASKVKEYKFSFTPTGSTYIIMVRPRTIVFQNDYSALLQVYSFNRNVGYSWLLSNTTQTIGTGTFTVSIGSGQVTVRDNYANYFPGIEYDVFFLPCA